MVLPFMRLFYTDALNRDFPPIAILVQGELIRDSSVHSLGCSREGKNRWISGSAVLLHEVKVNVPING
jgi:hypothetical protein